MDLVTAVDEQAWRMDSSSSMLVRRLQKTNGFGHCSRRTSMEDDESILEKMDDIPSCQERAREQATHVEFVSNLNMYSTANKMRLSGIVCTIGPVSREPA